MAFSDPRHEYGAHGETLIARKYEEWGYKIISRRYKTPYGEIDIIASKENTLVFIEAKTRSTIDDNEYISKSQIRRNCRAAELFLHTYQHYREFGIRFDLGIVINNQVYDIIENAWYSDR